MQDQTARRLLAATAVFVILGLFIRFQWELVCVAFAGALLGILLHTCTDWLARHSPMGLRLSYAAILLTLCGIVAAVALLIAPRATNQASQIAHTLPDSLHKATDYLQRKDWGRRALEVFVLYCAFHVIEGYLLTPLVQKKAVRLPPALTILTQLFFWDFGGVLAVAIAAPATAAAIVTVERLYIRKREPVREAASASKAA